MKIREARAATHAAKSLLDAQVPSQVALRFQSEIIAENLVLTARRTEPSRDAGMKVRIGFRNQIAAGKPVSPNVAELIEVIVPSAGRNRQRRFAGTQIVVLPAGGTRYTLKSPLPK